MSSLALDGTTAVHLTHRQKDVLACLLTGLSNRAIAAALVIDVRTVETHVASLFAKTGSRNRTQLTAWAFESGMREQLVRPTVQGPSPSSPVKDAGGTTVNQSRLPSPDPKLLDGTNRSLSAPSSP